MHRQVPVSANDSIAVTDTASQRTPDGLPASLGRFVAPAAAPDFTQSYDRLSQALAALPGRDPEAVLHQVQKSGKGCGLRWNNGEPSLIFGRQGSGGAKTPSSLEAELTQCAEAVEKLR